MRRIACMTFALVMIAAAEARAGSILPAIEEARAGAGTIAKHYVEVDPGVFVAVKGARERRQVRFARLTAGWTADQARIAAESGFPVTRWRNLTTGVLTEIWSYPELNRQFVFNAAGNLIETRLR